MSTTTFRIDELESQFTANTFTQFDALTPDVIGLSGGGYVLVYGFDNTTEADNDFPVLEFYDAELNLVSGSVQPAIGADIFLEFSPRITELSNGNILAVWDEGASGNDDVIGRIYTAGGTPVGNTFSVSGFANETFPDAAGLANGGFVIATDNATDVFFQWYDAAAVFQGDFEILLSGINPVSYTHLTLPTKA